MNGYGDRWERLMAWRLPLALCALMCAATCNDENSGSNTQLEADAGATDTSLGDNGASDSSAADDVAAGRADASADDSGGVAPTDTDVATPSCGSAAGPLPSDLVEIKYDFGTQVTSVAKQASWSVAGQKLNAAKMFEAVRFDVDRPVKVWGFRVMHDVSPAAKQVPVKAGLYADFGYNGFDFWSKQPLWEGDLCSGDLAPGQWATYALKKPLVLEQPGVLYVAHQRDGLEAASWAFSIATHPDCAGKPQAETNKCMQSLCGKFSRCHSAWNIPALKTLVSGGSQYYFWNGWSTSRPHNYMVRLLVEHVGDKPKAQDLLFQKEPSANPMSRQAWGDFDGDGWDDLLANGTNLYRWSTATNSFEDVTKKSGLAKLAVKASGGVWGDYDNDGCLDILLFHSSYWGVDSLLRNNCDGTFSDVTAKAKLDDVQNYNKCVKDGSKPATHAPSPAAAWIDWDSDGDLDIYLVNFICWHDFSFFKDTVWRNNGDGTFSNVSGSDGWWGPKDAALSGRGANPIDFDRDGDIDLFVNNYTLHRNLFFENLGGGKVKESGLAIGVAGQAAKFGQSTHYGHSIGAAWGDLDNDGDFDLVVANLAHPRFFNFSDKTQVLINDGKGSFADIQGDWLQMNPPVGKAGLRYQETHSVPTLQDFDNDGALDLAISSVYDGRPSDFYWGQGDGTFQLDVLHAGLAVTNGWGMAAADFDGDGAVDLAAKNVLYRNVVGTAKVGGRKKGAWLQVRARGTNQCNRAAIGATITVKAAGKQWLRHVSGATGQGCQDSQVAHFGLGDLAAVDSVDIDFPGAGQKTFTGPFKTGQRLWLFEDGTVHKGVAAPK